MADNQIKISVNLDSKELDQKFSGIMKKLQQMREAANDANKAMSGVTATGAGSQAKAGGTANQGVNAQQSDRSLQGLQKTLSSLTDRTDTFNKSLSNLSKTLDDLSNKAQQAATATQQQATATQQQASSSGGGGPSGTGGPTPPNPPNPPNPPSGGGFGIPIPKFSKILGLAGTALTAGGSFYKQIQTYPERIAQREASIAGMQSEAMRLQAQGKGYEMPLFAPERARALERAQKRVGAEKVSDMTGLGGTVLGGAALGAFSSAKFAAPLLAAPMGLGIPLYAGAVGLGALGGGASAFGGAMALSDRKRSMIFDQDAYKKEMGSVFAGTYKEQFEAERRKSYQKDLAGQFFEQESGRFRGLQRQYGLSDEELFQGNQSIFRKGARAGYNLDTMTQAMQDISAGGGPTAVATGGAQIAAKMQRNMDLTNAPELLGRISGATGMGAEESKNQIFRMYEQAQKLGLGQTEVSGLLQTGANMQYNTGGDLQAITELLSAGLEGSGLKTGKGIEYSKAALDQLRQQTSEMGGLTGQYGLAELGGKNINKLLGTRMVDGKEVQNELGIGEKAYLLGTDITKVSDEYLKGILEDKGQKADKESVANLRKEITKGKTRSTLRTDKQEELLKQYQTAKGPEKEKIMRSLKGEFAAIQGESFTKLSEDQQESKIAQAAAGLSGDIFTSKTTGEAGKKYETQSKRAADEKESAQAMDVAGSLKNLDEQIPGLIESFKSLKNAGEDAAAKWAQLKHLSDLLQNTTDTQKQQTEKDINNLPNADAKNVNTKGFNTKTGY
jgi:hypothetical protein